jgi:hypothetical protein
LIERRYSLRRAAHLLGLHHHTLKLWLQIDLGMVFPRARRGSKFLLREADIEAVVRKHSPQIDWKRLRGDELRRMHQVA